MRRLLQVIGAAIALSVIFTITWSAVAVHTVAPRTGPGDFVAAVFGVAQPHGVLAERLRQNGRINLLLLARGGAGDDNPDYTDTIMVLSIRPGAHRATMISLPRYMWVEIPAPAGGTVRGKLYAAYALGASQDPNFLRAEWRTPTGQGDLAAATVAATLAQPIDAWVAIDLDAFAAVIDAIGGVRLTIPETLDDPTYPSDVDERTIHIHFDPGAQTLDGRRALQYARSRLSTTEADRSRRQEIVLGALLSSLESAGLSPSLVGAAGRIKDGMRTDLTPADAQTLKPILRSVRQQDVVRITLDDSPLLVLEKLGTEQQPVLVPVGGSYQPLQQFVAGQLP